MAGKQPVSSTTLRAAGRSLELRITRVEVCRMSDEDSSNVVLIRTSDDKDVRRKALAGIWGNSVADHGYVGVPHVMLAMQSRMGLNPTQALVLLQLLDYWRRPGRPPFPSVGMLATRIGLKDRQLRRILNELERGAFIARNRRTLLRGGQTSNSFDLSGLVAKVKALEPEYRKAMQEARERKQESETPAKHRADKI